MKEKENNRSFRFYLTRGEAVVGHYGNPGPDDVAYLIDEFTTGEWGGWEPFGDTQRRFRQGAKVWLLIKDVRVFDTDFRKGDEFLQIVERLYSEYPQGEARQICGYCGAADSVEGWTCQVCNGT